MYNSPEKKVYIVEGDATLNPAIPFFQSYQSDKQEEDKEGEEGSLCATLLIHLLTLHLLL